MQQQAIMIQQILFAVSYVQLSYLSLLFIYSFQIKRQSKATEAYVAQIVNV